MRYKLGVFDLLWAIFMAHQLNKIRPEAEAQYFKEFGPRKKWTPPEDLKFNDEFNRKVS